MLGKLVGDMSEANPNTRWEMLIGSGCRMAKEFGESLEKMQSEARECCNFLGKSLNGDLSVDLAAVR